MNYWIECISEALDDVGIVASKEQIKNIAFHIEGAHENYGMAFGYECIPNPLEQDNNRLKKELKIEKDKVICRECGGRGRIFTQGPYHGSDTDCFKCKGEGRHL